MFQNIFEKKFGKEEQKEEQYRDKIPKLINPLPYNPFLDDKGNLFNKYMDHQAILDNNNVLQKVKNYITEATGLESTPTSDNSLEIKASEYSSEPESNYDGFGRVFAKYESGGWNPGKVSTGNGDYGGVSYGIPQFSTNMGSADKFVSWLKSTNSDIGKYFGEAKAGTQEFSNAWKKVANDYGDKFGNLQMQYAYDSYAKPLAELAKNKTGIDFTRSLALKELLCSTAVQFGGGSLGLSALGNINSNMSDRDIINASFDKKIANYKGYFKSSSTDVQEGVRNRFVNERNDMLNLLDTNTPTNDFSNPLSSKNITSNFGMRFHPVDKVNRMHNGIDLSASAGTPISSSTGGKVVFVGDKGDGYGTSVYLDNGNGMVTRYSHMQGTNMKLGDKVNKGQVIGTVGSTGKSTGPHLDFGIMINGKYVDPLKYLK